MSLKVSFRFNRSRFHGTLDEINNAIKGTLTAALNNFGVESTNIYAPTRDSIKVLFPSENEINKIFANIDQFKTAGLEPKISMGLKSKRTVFCFGFDLTLLSTYTHEELCQDLKDSGWKVNAVYIMQSKKSFKIEFLTTNEAKKFIDKTNTAIGGIQLKPESKEGEVDPTIPQCWTCGMLNPRHNSVSCMTPKRCLKCNSSQHVFYQCDIPKETNRMSQEQKRRRHCIPCNSDGDHTSLDHKSCPTKRNLVQAKIAEARENRKREQIEDKRDTELIKKTIELSNTEAWPALQQNQNQQQMTSTIILLALLDENSNPGVFQNKLDQGMQRNGLPRVQYTLEPNTARTMSNMFCAANHGIIPTPHNTHTPHNTSTSGTNTIPTPQNTPHTHAVTSASGTNTFTTTSLGSIATHTATAAGNSTGTLTNSSAKSAGATGITSSTASHTFKIVKTSTPKAPKANSSAVSRYIADTTKFNKRKAFAGGNKTLDDSALGKKDPKNPKLPSSQGTVSVPGVIVLDTNRAPDALAIYNELKNKISNTTLPLADSLENRQFIPLGKSKVKENITVKCLADLLKSDKVHLSLHVKQEMLLATDMLITAGYGDMKLTPEFSTLDESNHIQSPVSIIREEESHESDSSEGLYTDNDQYEFDESLTNYSGSQNPLFHRTQHGHEESDHTWTTNKLPGRWKLLGDAHNRSYNLYTDERGTCHIKEAEENIHK